MSYCGRQKMRENPCPPALLFRKRVSFQGCAFVIGHVYAQRFVCVFIIPSQTRIYPPARIFSPLFWLHLPEISIKKCDRANKLKKNRENGI